MKRAFTAAASAVALLLTGGCATGSTTPAASGPDAAASAGSYPVTVGGVTLARRPERIISLSPTSTEMLFAIGAGPQVVAVDDQSDYPAGVPKSDLSGFKPNAEAIAAKNPDLVIISNDIDKIEAQLAKLKIPVLVNRAATLIKDSYREIGDLGTLTGHRGEADTLCRQMAERIDKIVHGVPARGKPLSYYYELDPGLYSATSKTFVGSILTLFGMTDIADAADPAGAEGGYPQLSAESLIRSNPDVIFLADSKCCRQSAATVTARKGWDTVTAVKAGHVFALDDDVASRWGPRTVDLVQAVADAVVKVPA